MFLWGIPRLAHWVITYILNFQNLEDICKYKKILMESSRNKKCCDVPLGIPLTMAEKVLLN